jgi:diguanylate cyclase (GGDEF)-like protein/PAS domain S-box-containing protein
MPSPHRLPASLVGPLAACVAFYTGAAGALALTKGVNGIAVFWPANGILLAALLLAAPRDRWRYLVACALASFAANAESGVALIEAVGFTIANVAEALLAWRLVARRQRALPSFVDVPEVARFFLAAWAATLASATLATLFNPSHAVAEWSSWVTTDLLGLLIVTPAIITATVLARERHGRALPPAGEAGLWLAGIAALATLTFGQDQVSLLFLPVVAVLLATLRLGPFGAAASVGVIAVIGSIFTFVGHGPLWSAVQGGSGARVLYLQFYLLVLLATGLPLAALLASRDALVRRLGERNRLLHLAERSAGLGHWWISAGNRESCYFSPEVLRIHGVRPGDPPDVAALLADYHEDDRDRVDATLRAALGGGPPFDYEARIVTAAGEERRVHSSGAADRAADGTILGIFGTLQDVTRQVEDQHALEAARSAAEQAALLATAAAETDALTGVANRRKIVTLLADAIATAAGDHHPLSVAMLDLDHFKEINDRFGHLVGDRVLTHVARVAAASLRGADVVGRMGGEEFVLLLPSADAEQAAAIAERVRLAIGDKAGEALPRVTVSIGVATLTGEEDTATLLHRADCALYEAKRAGRNALRRAA